MLFQMENWYDVLKISESHIHRVKENDNSEIN